MTERPILFSAPMVRAILAGTKTQTRRVLKGMQPWGCNGGKPEWAIAGTQPPCPYGQPGDLLWVRETFAEGIHQMADVNHWVYAADRFGEQQRLGDRWKPSIHMPRAACRLVLEITSVRAERLQAISENDAKAEGIEQTAHDFWRLYGSHYGANATFSPRTSFRTLWESINGAESWAADPWVWVVEFRSIQSPA